MMERSKLTALSIGLVMFVINVEHVACSTSTNMTAINTLLQLTDKFITKFNSQLLGKQPEGRGRAQEYSYLDSFGHDLSSKSDYSWLIPLIVVIGFGTLLIPLMGTLMTTMVTQGTINLTAGRRRKRSLEDNDRSSLPYFGDWKSILENVNSAITKFSKHLNQ